MKNVILQLLQKKCFDVNSPDSDSFKEIIGHKDIKKIFNKAVISKKPVHILLVGSPGSAKTMFLLEIRRIFKQSLFVIASNTTKAGFINKLFEIKPKFVLIDELEKMNLSDQNSLLHLMETGIISETKVYKSREEHLRSWVFATANTCQKISKPLLSRFVILKIPDYTFEEFEHIAITRLKKEHIKEKLALEIAHRVWHELDSKDIRNVIKIARLADGRQELDFIINAMK